MRFGDAVQQEHGRAFAAMHDVDRRASRFDLLALERWKEVVRWSLRFRGWKRRREKCAFRSNRSESEQQRFLCEFTAAGVGHFYLRAANWHFDLTAGALDSKRS